MSKCGSATLLITPRGRRYSGAGGAHNPLLMTAATCFPWFLPLKFLLALVIAAGAAAAHAQGPPAEVLALFDINHDDPRAALAAGRARLATQPTPEMRYWLLLATARSLSLLEDSRAERQAVAEAAEALVAMTPGRSNLMLWLDHARLQASVGQEEPRQVLARMQALQEPIRSQGDERLRCEFTNTQALLLLESASFDEAWLAAEELERCAQQLKLPELQAVALAHLGTIGAAAAPPGAAATPPGSVAALPATQASGAGTAPLDPFTRALALLGERPARFRRSLLEYAMGSALRDRQQHAAALVHLRRALEASREIDDRAGIAAADIAIARLHLAAGQHEAMAPLLEEARLLLIDHDDGSRMSDVAGLRVLALAREKRPEVLAEIDHARRWDRATLPPGVRVRLARALAEGLASQGQWQQAYAELARAQALEKAGREQARDVQVLRLQSRYDTVRRDAENAALRHRNEAAQLALEAQTARQRALWLALAALAVLAASAGAYAWRGLQRRRTLLDLASKDPLTGNPNRRAVTAYAQAQLEQTRRLSMPLSVAMIDLDHFKRVNDTHGHGAGDELLRAFAEAGAQVLRGQDRLGRWGGEEWLLVMPGTPGAELPNVFERLRERYRGMRVPGLPHPHGCTFSMGGATASPDAPATLQALIAQADENLYRAKAEGRDAVRG